ncbi:MAG: ASKHA domain-containing protein [Spirochaetota bacterium]
MNTVNITFKPQNITVWIPEGSSIIEAAQAAGIKITGPCGGKGTCGKCKVIVRDGISPLSNAERQLLEKIEINAGCRLACQTKVFEATVVEIPADANLLKQRILDHGISRPFQLNPIVKKQALEIRAPSMADQRDDLSRVLDVLGERNGLNVNLTCLRKLPKAIRNKTCSLTIIRTDRMWIDIKGLSDSEKIYGLAVDIGTTTVVGYLCDLETGKQAGVASITNPQVEFGDDVIARITYTTVKYDGLQKLHAKIIGGLNEIIEQLKVSVSIDRMDIYTAVMAGNTTMQHLFLGLDPRNIAPAPFIPVASRLLTLRAADLKLHINPEAPVVTMPNVSGYVGGDIVSGILAVNLFRSKEIKLFIDVGTNGEVVLGSEGNLFACSAAAGPAFEGAMISQGMRAVPGAIESVVFDNDNVYYKTIDNVKPRGICGSGLLDLVAQMFLFGIIEKSGRICESGSARIKGGEGLRKRIVDADGMRKFLVYNGDAAEDDRPIYITQKDVREMQLAKGAIRAGINILMETLKITPDDISEVLLAGGFGNYIKKESALAVGMIPAMPEEKIKSVGNSAGEGAKIALLSKEELALTDKIAREVTYIELSNQTTFQNEFIKCMSF